MAANLTDLEKTLYPGISQTFDDKYTPAAATTISGTRYDSSKLADWRGIYGTSISTSTGTGPALTLPSNTTIAYGPNVLMVCLQHLILKHSEQNEGELARTVNWQGVISEITLDIKKAARFLGLDMEQQVVAQEEPTVNPETLRALEELAKNKAEASWKSEIEKIKAFNESFKSFKK